MDERLPGDAAAEWKAYWPVVAAACAAMAISTINVYSTGLFMAPLQKAFGWSRAAIFAGPAIPALSTVFIGPFMGAAVDRFGPRRLAIIGVTAVAVLTAMLSLVTHDIRSWWAMWVLLACVNGFIQPTIWTAAIASFFSAGRGLALAVTLSGSGIASLVTPLVTLRLIDRFGWRGAFIGLAVFWGAIVIPLVLAFFTSRTDRAPATARRVAGYTWREARSLLASRRFIQLALAAFLIAAVVVPFAISLVPILSWTGLPRAAAAETAALLGLSSIPGRLAIGYLLDRIDGRYLAAFSLCLPILSSLLMIGFPGSRGAASAAVLILGFALGAELDIVSYLCSRYFGLKRFGLAFGSIAGLVTLAGGGGPWVVSLVYDHTLSYLPALLAYLPMCLVSASLFLTLGRYPALGQDSAANGSSGRLA